MRSAIVTYATACAFGNMYSIFRQAPMNQSGTFAACMASSISGFRSPPLPAAALPLRTNSMMVNAIFGGTP